MISRRRVLCGMAAGLVLPALSGCKTNESTYRFRLTVEVDTPEGVRSGFSVMEVSAWGYSAGMNGQRRGMTLRGEAVAVDLPGGRTLFALLRTKGANPDIDLAMASMAALDQDFRNDWVESAGRIERLKAENLTAVVRPDDYPMLVTFGAIADPTSVEEVDPDDLEASFGPGVRLRRITVQLTDEDVTTGIESRLAILGIEPDRSLDSDFEMTTNPTLAQELGYDDFIKVPR